MGAADGLGGEWGGGDAAEANSLVGVLGGDGLRAALEGVYGVRLGRMMRDGAPFSLDDGAAGAIDRAADAHEMASIYMWRHAEPAGSSAAPGAPLRAGELEGLCRQSFAMLEARPLPSDPIQRMCHVLLLFSYAYVGERWDAMARYLGERGEGASVPCAAADAAPLAADSEGGWEYDMLAGVYTALLCVVRKRDMDELRRARAIVERLRTMQGEREGAHLKSFKPRHRLAPARRLASLYHMARCVELLAEFMGTGKPANVEQMLDLHFGEALAHGDGGGSAELDVIVRAVRPAFKRMVRNSAWFLAGRAGDDGVAGFARSLPASDPPVFELLRPQKDAIEAGLLDPHKSMLATLPESGGRTLLAELGIAQAVHRGGRRRGGGPAAAYVVPTSDMADRIAPRLRRDLAPAGITVEKMSGAAGINSFEYDMLRGGGGGGTAPDVLVATPEKMLLLIRIPDYNLAESIALCIVDEAHNLGDAERGPALELLVSTVRRAWRHARLLLLAPAMPDAGEVAAWLDPGGPRRVEAGAGRMPGDRIVGAYYARGPGEGGAGAGEAAETRLRALPNGATDAAKIDKDFKIGTARSLGGDRGCDRGHALTSLLAAQLDVPGGLLILVPTIRDAWDAACLVCENLDGGPGHDDMDVGLAKRFVASELGNGHPLAGYLNKGVGVHHAGLPGDVRFLMERLMEAGRLRALVGTADIARGPGLPASAVLVSPRPPDLLRGGIEPADFWRLAGGAGPAGLPSPRLVGFAADEPGGPLMKGAEAYAGTSADRPVSALAGMVREALAQGAPPDLSRQAASDLRWSALAQYASHMRSLGAVPGGPAGQAEAILRSTLGHGRLDRAGRAALRGAVRRYLSGQGPDAQAAAPHLAGLSAEAAAAAGEAVQRLDMSPVDWMPRRLFASGSGMLPGLIAAMAKIPGAGEISAGMGGGRDDNEAAAALLSDWVSGMDIPGIARRHFGGGGRDGITDCMLSVCGRAAPRASRGLAALRWVYGQGTGGPAPEGEGTGRRPWAASRNASAMAYYGVDTDAAVLMRMNSVPRSAARGIGMAYGEYFEGGRRDRRPVGGREIGEWLSGLEWDEWIGRGAARRERETPRPGGIAGSDLKAVWSLLSGRAAACPVP